MADFRKMMAEKNKKAAPKTPKDDIAAVEKNRGDIADPGEEIGLTRKVSDISEIMDTTDVVNSEEKPAPEEQIAAKEQKEETVLVPEDKEVIKTNVSLSKTSVNYIRMNSKRQRIGQMQLFEGIINDLKNDPETKSTELTYDNYEGRKRHIIDNTPLSLYLPKKTIEWLKDRAAENCVSLSQYIDEAIQDRIHTEKDNV